MGITKKYQNYKRILQISIFLNIFFLGFGAVAFSHWIQTHDITSIEMTLIGLSVFIFGVLIPIYIFSRISNEIGNLKKQSERLMIQCVDELIVAFKGYDDGEAIKDPKFWINIGLVIVELVGERSKHPAMQMVAEVAPAFRKELKAATKKHEKSKHSSTHKIG